MKVLDKELVAGKSIARADNYVPPTKEIAMPKPGWMAAANCATSDPAIFYHEPESPKSKMHVDGLVVCADCKVWEQCLVTAMLRPEKYGIWGGSTVYIRKKVAARLRKAGYVFER